jgi:hypothetical protein
VNQPDPYTGQILNDLTLGEYDIIVSNTPARETLEDSQFEQAVSLRELGVNIPDETLIENSRLNRRGDIIKQMREAAERYRGAVPARSWRRCRPSWSWPSSALRPSGPAPMRAEAGQGRRNGLKLHQSCDERCRAGASNCSASRSKRRTSRESRRRLTRSVRSGAGVCRPTARVYEGTGNMRQCSAGRSTSRR